MEVKAVTVIAEEDEEVEKVKLSGEESSERRKDELEEVLKGFSDVLCTEPGMTDRVTMKINLVEGAGIISQAPYRLPDKLREPVRLELESLLKAGIIEEGHSEWASPLVPVKKPNGQVRLCVDFRKINEVTPQSQWYLPGLDDILRSVGEAKFLSKLDLNKGFHQVLMDPDSKDLTTFTCPFGKFRYNRMPFGLKNAPATFQRLIENVLRECKEFASAYIDDVIIYSKSWEQHLVHIAKVLGALRDAGLKTKPE